MNKDPYGQLASALYSSVGKHAKLALGGAGAVLGTMTGTGLKLDDFKHELQDYMVAELPGLFSVPRFMMSGTTAQVEQPDWDHKQMDTSFYFDKNEVKDVSLKLVLQPGDRVLVLRVNGGNDAVVICKVVSGHG
ncbi:hypothetical protein GRF59_13185 [Paenibacillus sp. HJL G12]|uniref:DUF2577 domain-containing protein n=1 Tax=Paenibacillus dendrobii TaxID=2691084 RepID=A0A7X3IM58_9BACL|nr:hypothetical protein [Paenibacillus dendrobii]MWV44582.1 hypothetical protein [Paenibacillus dendrobii]